MPDYNSLLDGNVKGMKIGLAKEYYETDLLNNEVRENVMKAIDSL